MSTHTARVLMVAVLVGFAAMAAMAVPAEAQEWKIYLVGKSQPIVASFYAEESPWIFYHDDQSMYVFALGCNRIARIERGGAPVPAPACPVEKLPTTMPVVYGRIIDLETKRLDDAIAKLREQTRAYAQAVIGAFAATGELVGPRAIEAETKRLRALEAAAFLQSQMSDTLFDIRLIDQRVGLLFDAAKSYPRAERQRFFFFTK